MQSDLTSKLLNGLWRLMYNKNDEVNLMDEEFTMDDEERLNFDFESFSYSELDAYDGKGGWMSGSLEHESLRLNLDPTWL